MNLIDLVVFQNRTDEASSVADRFLTELVSGNHLRALNYTDHDRFQWFGEPVQPRSWLRERASRYRPGLRHSVFGELDSEHTSSLAHRLPQLPWEGHEHVVFSHLDGPGEEGVSVGLIVSEGQIRAVFDPRILLEAV